MCGGTPHLLIASKPLLGRCKDALILCALAQFYAKAIFVMDRLYPVRGEAQPVHFPLSLWEIGGHALAKSGLYDMK